MNQNDLNAEVISQYENYCRKKQGHVARIFQSKMLQLASIVLFVIWGISEFDFKYIVMLILVIGIHELGHVIGIIICGGKVTSVLFLPVMGGGVTITPQPLNGFKSIIGILLGPLSGLLIGGISFLIYLNSFCWEVLAFAYLSLYINVLNLLPIWPLDGGKILEILLPKNSTVFHGSLKVISGLTFLLLAFYMKSFFMASVAVLIILAIVPDYILIRIVSYLDENNIQSATEEIPRIVTHINTNIKRKTISGKALAYYIYEAFRLRRQVSIKGNIKVALFVLFTALLIGGALLNLGFNKSDHFKYLRTKILLVKNEEKPHEYSVYKKGQLLVVLHTDSNGVFDGKYTKYFSDGKLWKEGYYSRGKWDGEWVTYNKNSDVVRKNYFKNGELQYFLIKKDGAWIEQGQEHLTQKERKILEVHRKIPPKNIVNAYQHNW